MRDDLKNMILSRRHCVLATAAEGVPYCSLMAYAVDPTCTRFFMVTHRNTRKFRNLINNSRVSLLIDSRDTPNPQALTIEGTARETAGEADRTTAVHLLLAGHPSLSDFISAPEAVVLCVTAVNAVFLNGLTDVYYEKF